VQGWLDESMPDVTYIGSPSVQMFLDENCLSLHDITEQILSPDSVNEGNIAPPPYLADDEAMRKELLRQAQIVGTWLHHQGYRGTASTDFHLVERCGRQEVRVCEINARVTGATYPAILARHFTAQGAAWLMRNIRFTPSPEGPKIMEGLKKEGLLYRSGSREGVLPFNFNQDDKGTVMKGQFLFLGPETRDTVRLLHAMKDIESLKGDYDRD